MALDSLAEHGELLHRGGVDGVANARLIPTTSQRQKVVRMRYRAVCGTTPANRRVDRAFTAEEKPALSTLAQPFAWAAARTVPNRHTLSRAVSSAASTILSSV